ncbi:MAG: hypothetical protein Q3963_02675, partial [Coriobacteriaceae bacterium]|nr:hypothetical protein [Coriobacteriaceae bacterium]
MRKPMIAFVLALVLAVGLCPAAAFAAMPDGGSSQASGARLTIQAEKDLGECTIKFTDKQHQGKASEWWQLYFVKGKSKAAAPAFDVYLGKTKVPKSKYTVSFKRSYWDADREKEVTKKVKASQLTPSGNPDDKTSCEYRIVVKAKAGSGYTGSCDNAMICVSDQYGIGHYTEMRLAKAKAAWRYAMNGMNSNYYVIPAGSAKSTLNSLKLIAGKTAIAKKSYTVSYYKAKRNVVKNGSPIEKAKTGKKLGAAPSAAGSYVMVIKGKKPYYGTDFILFDIQDKMSKVTVATVKTQKYTGKAITPELTVKYKGATLKLGRDYTVTYKNNVEAGTATAIIRGCSKVWAFEPPKSMDDDF